MQTNTSSVRTTSTSTIGTSQQFLEQISLTIEKCKPINRSFFILVFQIENIEMFKQRRSEIVVLNLVREMANAVRKVVHPTQFVSRFHYGLGLLFDAVESGDVDTIAKKLVMLLQNVIKAGRYNDLSGRWSEILSQFLHPSKPGLIFPKVGWAVYPRDGQTPQELVKRAICHIAELSR